MTQITYQNPNIRFRQGLRYHGAWEHDCWIDGKQHKLVVGDNSYDGRREYFSGLSDEVRSGCRWSKRHDLLYGQQRGAR